MKTHITENTFLTFYNNKLKPLCVSFSENGVWRSLLSLLLPPGVFPVEHNKKSSTKSLLSRMVASAYAGLGPRVFRVTNIYTAASANKRIFLGLGFAGMLAPMAGSFYVYLSREVIDSAWYYRNYFNLFLVLGPSLKMICVFLGVFFLFPKNSKRAYLLALPIGEEIGKIIWLSSITTNEQYWSIAPMHILFVGFVIAIVLLICSDWLSWRFFHKELAFDSRLKGIEQLVDEETISDSKFRSMFRTTLREKKEFQKQY